MSRYLSLVVIELKKPGVPARAAFDENLTHHKQRIPALFWFNALLIASNGTDSRVGSLTADWERFWAGGANRSAGLPSSAEHGQSKDAKNSVTRRLSKHRTSGGCTPVLQDRGV